MASGLASLFGAFKSGTPAPTPAPGSGAAPASGGTPTPAGTSGIPQNQPNNPGADPANQNKSTQDSNASPLDAFKDLWKIDDKTSAKDPLAEPLFAVDATKLADATKRMDFSKVVPPELITKALGGDAAAFAQALNLVAQQNYGVSTHMVTNLIDQAIQRNNQRFSATLGDRFKNFQASENLRSANPVFNHPATAPIVDALRTQLTRQNPTASATEITQAVQDYLNQFASALSGKQGANSSQEGGSSEEIDWSLFLDPDSK